MLSRRRFLHSGMVAAAATLPATRSWSALLAPASTIDRDLDAITGDGKPVALARAAVQELADSLRGNLILPGHAAYDPARRVWNAQMNRRPALIVQPRGAADVRSAVQFARSSSLLVAVKCGGHSPSGKSTCERGMLIDLSLLRGVRVDPEARIARAAGGSLLGDLDHEAMAHGLVTTAGTVSHTGVGGLTLGGGFGRVARRFGLALDNVRGVEIVTATGEILRASPQENAELYWGTRGGGGNFGVVTAFDFDLHPMQRQVIGGTMLFPLAQAKDVMRFYSEYEAEAPDDLYLSCAVASNQGFSGRSAVAFIVCYSGPVSGADKIMRTLRSAGKPIADDVRPIDYVALQRSGDLDEKRAIGSYTKTGFVKKISPGLIDAMINGLVEHPERATVIGFQHCGGAISRVAADATAFPHRGIHATSLLAVDWPGEVDPTRHIDWLLKYWATIVPHTDGFYTNDATEETQKQLDENYMGNLSRLVQLKNKYDPGNLFRLNANVKPSA
ncbi:MAG TPA: FAD-binding protein [Steroidobacteraceae bacterium]|nr:FAD-binding protein [Steroidobacteraceae bacterium]